MQINTIPLSEQDIIILNFPRDEYDVQEMSDIFNKVKDVLPTHTILCMPEDISLTVLKKENIFL